ncbi:unnamed protein product, partial [Microthlaspi erraticum]
MNPGGEGAPNRPTTRPTKRGEPMILLIQQKLELTSQHRPETFLHPIRTRPMQLSRYSHLLTRRDHHRRLQMDIIVTVTTKGCLKTNLTHL